MLWSSYNGNYVVYLAGTGMSGSVAGEPLVVRRAGRQQRVHQAGALGPYLLRRVAIGELSCLRRPSSRFRVFVSYWLTRPAGRSGWPSPFPPARTGMRAPMAAGCGGHRMEPVEACWTRATSTAGWWCMLRPRGPRPGSSRCRRTSRGNGSKASRRTLSSNTSLAVRSALILGSVSTRWSLPTRILPALTSPRDFSPVVCGPPPCPCRQSLELACICVPQQRSAGVRVSTNEVETQEIQHEKPTLPFSDQWSFGYWTHPWLGCRFCAAG